MHRSHFRLALGVMIAAVSLIVAGAAGGAPKKASAGALVFGAEQEPPCLNGFLAGCNNTWTSWTAGIALASLYIEKPNFTLVPYMAAGPAKITTLLKYAALCGVGNSLNFLKKRSVSLAALATSHSPESFVGPIEDHLRAKPDSAIAQLHVFPFGGIKNTARWLYERGSWQSLDADDRSSTA